MIVAGREVGRTLDPIPCSWCKAPFTPQHITQTYCCPSCKAHGVEAYRIARNARRAPKTPKPCKHCGAVFTPVRKSRLFCCDRCKDAYWGRIHNDIRNEKARAIRIERRAELEKAEADRIAARNAKAEAARIAKIEKNRRTCQYSGCGKEFQGHANALYCCISCSYKAAYLRIREVHLAKEKAKTIERALKRPVVICAHPGCPVEFRQKQSNNVFCDAHGRRAKRAPRPENSEAPNAVRGALRNATELASASTVATKAAKASTANSVKHCLDRRGLECRKFFGKKCFDVRNLKQCGKTL